MKLKISDLVERVVDNRGKTPPCVDEGIPLIEINAITENKMYPNYNLIKKHITDDTYNSLRAGGLKEGDILVGTVGSLGTIAIMDNTKAAVAQNLVALRTKKDVNPIWLYYSLRFHMNEILNLDIGGVQPSIKVPHLLNFMIDVPSHEKQNKIAKILFDIDSKIELNNKISENLNKLSECYYKKFIKSINDNEECYFKDCKKLGNIIMGQSPKGASYNYEEQGLPLINGAADYEEGYLKAQKYTSSPIKTCDKGDLIFCIRATIGLLVTCDKQYCLGRGVAGIINIDPFYKEYTYHLINASIEDFKRMATGSVIVGTNRETIEKISIKIPTTDEIEKYHSIQEPIFDMIENVRKENINLKKLRDILLSEIMSGKIDIDKIEV